MNKMNKRLIFALFTVTMLFNLSSVAIAQVLKPDLMFCGSSQRHGSDLYLGVGPFNEVQGCAPGVNTQALLVTRYASISGNGAAWLAYLDTGGVIITEHSSANRVYNEIYGTAYAAGAWVGNCTDNAMPSTKLNPDHEFWQLNTGLIETAPGSEGCGLDLIALVGGEAAVTALGGIIQSAAITFAIRPQGQGVLWLLEADWQDSQSSYTDMSKNFMGVLISGGTFSVGLAEAVPVPVLSTLGLVLLVLGFVFLSRRRIKV